MKISAVLIISLLLISVVNSVPTIPKPNIEVSAPKPLTSLLPEIPVETQSFSLKTNSALNKQSFPVHAEVTTAPSAPSGYKCLSSHGKDPRAWNVETIEEYCTRAMLKCQCNLANNNMGISVRTASKYEQNEKIKIKFGRNLEANVREEISSVTGWRQMCELEWIKEAVCDEETKDCAVELFGRFVFGYGVGAVKAPEHETWWTICDKKLEAEGEFGVDQD